MRQLRNILSSRLLTALLAGLLLCVPAFAWGDSWGKNPTSEMQTMNGGLNNESAEALKTLGRTAEAETAFTNAKEMRSSKSEIAAAQEMNASPTIAWQKCLGGNGLDSASDVQQTTDGGYIIAGYTDSTDGDVKGYHKGSYAWIVKLDKSGATQWQKCLGGTGADEAKSIQQTTDGGYIVAGSTSSTDGDVKGYHSKSGKLMLGGSVININLGGGDVWVVKLDKNGAIQWQNCLGGTDSDSGYDVRQTSDGGYIVAASTGSNDGDVKGNHGSLDAWAVKLDKSGAIQWQKCLGGTGADEAKSIQQTTDGGYIVAGSTKSTDGDIKGNHGDNDAWVVKLDNSGTIQWQKCLGGTSDDQARSVQQTSGGGYIVAGYTESTDGDIKGNHGSFDVLVIELDKSGTMQWQRCLGGSNFEQVGSIQQTTDGGYIVAGLTYSDDGDVKGNNGAILGSYAPGVDAWVIKLDKSGVIQWQKCLGGTSDDRANSIQQSTDGGYIIAGSTSSNDGDVSGWHGSISERFAASDYWMAKIQPD